MARIKLGLIGCGGNMRGAHLPRIQANKFVELCGIADTSADAVQAFAEKWGAPLPAYSDYTKMLQEQELDAVMISSPHNTHYAQARRALDAGCHVLVEKPLTIRAADTKALLATAKRKKRILHVSYQRHHYPVYRCVRDLVRAGAIGEPRALIAYVTQGWGWGHNLTWRLVPKLSGGGMFMDTGSHLVAAALFTTGWHVDEVTAFTDHKDKKVDILAAVSLRFREGAVGTICTVGQASRHDERLALHGTKGCLVIHLHQWGLKSVLLNDAPLKIPARYKEDTPDAAFFRWIRGAKGYEPPLYALEVQHLSEAAYKSAKSGRRVKVAR
ncbi:MAG: Gfo/Idh/MocA family oxidoreductase [Planctomycetes bacterium]|nr:Gfo/Idh/MocA family oxidoreductase [Planctomycetota bacterium]